MNTLEIKRLANDFTESCRVVAQATKDGIITKERASAGKETVKVTSTIAASHGLDGDALKDLKMHVSRYNAGHAFQDTFKMKLAWLGTYADGQKQVEEILTENGAAIHANERTKRKVGTPALDAIVNAGIAEGSVK